MKNKRISFLIFFFLPIFSYSQAPESMYQLLMNGDIVRYVYSGGDEFSGTKIDVDKWDKVYPWANSLVGNHELQYYTTNGANTYLDNGLLKIVTKQEQVWGKVVEWYSNDTPIDDGHGHISPNYRQFDYTSGMLFSKQKYEYGLFEIRFKPSYNSKGLWPAFWLYNGVCKGEIDIFEMKGEWPNKTHYGTVCDNNCDGNGNDCDGQWVTATGNFPDNFNIMRGEWTPNYVAWSLNNQEYAVRFQPYPDPMWVIINVAVASDGGAFAPGPDASTIFPSIFEVDYIRIWTKVDCNLSVARSNYIQTPSSPTVITGRRQTMGSTTTTSPSAIVDNGQYLTMVCTDYVRLLPGFHSRPGSHFWANVVPCPLPLEGIVAENEFSSIGPLQVERQKQDEKETGNDDEFKIASSIGTSQEPIDEAANKPVLYTRIYPNPSQGYVMIEFEGAIERFVKIELLGSDAKIVFEKEIDTLTPLRIDVSSFHDGVYYLRCIFGDKYVTDKIIINRLK